MVRSARAPTEGLLFATSGVWPEVPNVLPLVNGELFPELNAGLAYCVWLRRLKTSHRNSPPNRSPNFQSLMIEASHNCKPLPRNVLRAMVPYCPSAGGIIIELPRA